MVHSSRSLRLQLLVVAVALLAVAGLIWTSWWLKPGGRSDLRRPLAATSALIPAFFAGSYMIQRNRRVTMDRQMLILSADGLRWRTPVGITEVPWSAVEEVRIGMRPAAGRSPDVLIKTDAGYIGAFMRWVDAAGPIPEPSLLQPGRGFLYPGGERMMLSPENSPLVRALKEFCPREKIKEGAVISI
jgi:hypothetical protein